MARLLDLFAGPGGWSEGARMAGMECVGLEWDMDRADVSVYPPEPSRCRRPCAREDGRRASVCGLIPERWTSWPAALSKTRIAYRARISPKAIDVVLEELIEEGLVAVTETDAGNPRYFARRALVEASGRTYGMGS